MKMMPPDVISHENQLQRLSEPSIFMLDVFRTADHADRFSYHTGPCGQGMGSKTWFFVDVINGWPQSSWLSGPILKNLGFLGFFKNENPENLYYVFMILCFLIFKSEFLLFMSNSVKWIHWTCNVQHSSAWANLSVGIDISFFLIVGLFLCPW